MILRPVRGVPAVAFLAALLSCAGCAIPTNVAVVNPKIPRDLTPVAIDAGLRAMDDPATKAQIISLLRSPEVRDAQKELVAGMIDGSLATLSDKDRADRIGAMSARYMGSVLKGLLQEHRSDLDGAMSDATHGALKGLLRPDNQREMARLFGSIAEASMKPIADTLSSKSLGDPDTSVAFAKAISEQVGPALEVVLRSHLAQAVESEPMRRAIRVTARDVGYSIVMGVNDGVMEIRASSRSDKSSVVDSVGGLINKGATMVSAVTLFLVALVVGLGIAMTKLLLNAKRSRIENERQLVHVRLLAEAMKASEGKPWAGELIATLQQQLDTK